MTESGAEESVGLPIPGELAELVADLERDTGFPPTVEEVPGVPGTARRWLLTHRNDRVTMTLLCKPAKRDRYAWLKSTLTVDGEPRQVAENYEHLVRIFNDPDGALSSELPMLESELHRLLGISSVVRRPRRTGGRRGKGRIV